MESTLQQIASLVGELPPITLEQMKSIRLMNRTDTKFVTSLPNLAALWLLHGQVEQLCREFEEKRNGTR